MIAFALISFVGLFVLSVLALMLARSASLDYGAVRTRLHEPDAEAMAYDVPNGQDAAALIVALGRAGYPAVEDLGGGMHQVLVSCPHGRIEARTRVRAVLQEAGAPLPTPVSFADER